MTRLSAFLVFFAALFVCSISAEGQRLVFPRVLSVQELSTTGFALVNTSASNVDATLTFYSPAGQVLTSKVLSVPARGQTAKLGSEVFNAATSAGWVLVTSSNPELQGFELIGDFATVVDGAGPTPEATQLAVIAFSGEDVLNLVNTSSQSGTAQIGVAAANGSALGSRSVPLTPFQGTSLRLADINGDNSADLISLSADVAISASLTTKLPNGRDVAVTNAVAVSGAPSTLYFPFTPNGPQGSSNWTTLIAVSNLSSTAQTISITFSSDSGAPTTVQRTLAPRATLYDSVAGLFRLPNTYTPGWIQVSGAAGLTGVAAYQDSANGSLATVPSQSAGATRYFFGHIASLPPWYTGLALLNTTSNLANVELSAIDPNGQLIGSPATFFMQGGSRLTAVLSEFVPQVLQRASDGGFVFIRTLNSVPLLGFELFGHAVAPVLANVQGFPLLSGSNFTPPTGGGGPLNITIDKVTFATGSTTKTQFQPGDGIVYIATVTNSTGGAVPAQYGFEVTDPRGQAMISFVASGSVPPGTTTLSFSSQVPSNALTGKYTVSSALNARGQIASNSGQFDVINGSTTGTVTQDTPNSTSTANALQVAFRPGDVARFYIRTSNFTGQPVQATFNYILTGPGALNAGQGSITVSVPPGLSARPVDMPIPTSAPLGLFSFSSTMTLGTTTAIKGTVITVVPVSGAEAASLDTVFISNTNGIPQGSVTPGSAILLTTGRFSAFPTNLPATVRYTVTDSNNTAVFDEPINVSLLPGSTSALVLTTAGAAPGNYTFRGTLSYLDNSSQAQTSTLSTDFTLTNTPTPLTPSISARRVYVADINGIPRSSVSPGETLLFVRTVYSTYPTPVTGTVRYLLTTGPTTAIDSTLNATFNPGLNIAIAGVSTAPTIPRDTYTIAITAVAQGQTSSTSTSFQFAGGVAPNTTFSFAAQSTRRPSLGPIQFDFPLEELPMRTDMVDEKTGMPITRP